MGKSKSASTEAPKKSRKVPEAAKPTYEDIALRAYHIYLERGCTPGDPMQDWLQAEQELVVPRKKVARKTKVVLIAA